MTKAGIASNTTFEETTLLMTILRKTLFLKFSAILSTGSGIQGGVEQVTSLVPHRLDLGVQVSLLVLQEVPGLIDEGAVGSPGLSVHLLLHHRPVLDAGVLVKAAGDYLPGTIHWNGPFLYRRSYFRGGAELEGFICQENIFCTLPLEYLRNDTQF